jgi:hypothetical protein
VAYSFFSIEADISQTQAGYKIIIFEGDTAKLGGKCLKNSARHGTNPRNRVCAHLLRWHLRMCVYRNLKANADIQAVWEDDLGSDDMGQILEQPDAGHRMEVELFTRSRVWEIKWLR